MVRPEAFTVSTTREFLKLALVAIGQEEAVKRSQLGGDFAAKFSSVKRTAALAISLEVARRGSRKCLVV